MSGSFVRRSAFLGASLLCAGMALLSSFPGAHADTLLVESFTNGTVANPTDWVGGGSGGNASGWPDTACLTAGSNTAQSPIAGCGLESADAAGGGALRLTPADGARAGFALYNHALPTTGGLDMSFDQAQYGGSGADGVSFFLVDGSTDLTEPGSSGGGLGYTAGNENGSNFVPGIDNGLLAIGIDKWGNFSSSQYSGSGCAAGTGVGSAGPGPTANVVTIRGDGDGTVGYCWLGSSADLGSTLGGSTRAAATVHVHIVIDPASGATRNVKVSLNGTQVIQVPATAALLAATSFKFGFAGSTGDVTDYHDVWNLQINSVVPVPATTLPVPATTLPGASTTSVAPGSPTTTMMPGSKTAPQAAPAAAVSGTPSFTG